MKVFDLEFDPEFRKEFYKYCDQIFDEAYLTNHTFVKKFEEEFAAFQGTPLSMATSNGTSALEIAFKVADIRGREVILPTNTFIATFLAVLNAGGIPKIVDVENQYYSLCPRETEKAITNKTAGIVTVHIGGHLSPSIEKLFKISQHNKIDLIEDAAQAHGASFRGKRAGQWGRMASFSHFMTKIMTMGEGGSITFQTEADYLKGLSLRQFGKQKDNELLHETPSGNYKLTEFQAALGLLELKRINERIEKRRQLAGLYQQFLQGSRFKVLSDPEDGYGTYYKQIIISDIPRHKIVEQLSKKGMVVTGGVYFNPLHKQPVVKNLFGKINCPVAEHFSEFHFCPPCYPEVDPVQVESYCQELLKL